MNPSAGLNAYASANPKKRLRPKHKEYAWGYLMIAPLFIGLCVLFIWPVFQTFYFSFTDWSAFGQYTWTGADNYRKLLNDPEFFRAFGNTLLYVVTFVPSLVALSVLAAVLLNQKIRGVGTYRTIYFIPAIMLPAAVAMVWRWLFNADYGLINAILRTFSIQGPRWLTDPDIALYSVVIVGLWSTVGFQTVIVLSGLQAISSSYYEVAAIEGAGPFVRFFRITLPLLTPTVFFVTVTSLINAFQVFDLIYMMIGNVAIDQAQTIVYFFYKKAFVFNEKGYASAVAMVLFAVILIVTAFQMRLQNKWVFYE